MINIKKLKSKTISFVLSTAMIGTTMVSCSNNTIDKLSRKGIDIEVINEYDDNNIYKMNSFNTKVIDKFDKSNFIINNVPDVDYSILCTPSTFSKYSNESNVTYEDIKNTINNIDIDNNIKKLLLKGINNLENNKFNMDLSVLNYNLKHLNIEYRDNELDELSQAVAKFEPENSTVIVCSKDINSDEFEDMFFHEIFGHGMTTAYIKEKDVFCSTSFPVCIIDDNKYKGNYELGRAFSEGLAEIIRKNATNRKIDNEESFYSPCIYSLLILLKSNNISISEYADNGVEYLIDKLKSNNLGKQISYIEALDKKLLYLSFYDTDIEYKLEELIIGYIYDLIDNDISNNMNIKDIDNDMNTIINSYKNYIKPFTMDDMTILSMITSNSGDYITIENIVHAKNEYLKQYRAIK